MCRCAGKRITAGYLICTNPFASFQLFSSIDNGGRVRIRHAARPFAARLCLPIDKFCFYRPLRFVSKAANRAHFPRVTYRVHSDRERVAYRAFTLHYEILEDPGWLISFRLTCDLAVRRGQKFSFPDIQRIRRAPMEMSQ